ncbi:MAG TPA: S8 family serine peptidase [Jatrophihabitans sp.]|jgi:subtilisin family serine protease|nr:S8 family serine peptidase [Jatrophihabitans sp.]
MRRLRTVLAALLAAVLGVLAVPPSPARAAPGPSSAPQWWFDAWNVRSLWAGGADGRGITVAVIDSGVQADVPELRGKVLAGADFTGNGSDGRTDYDSDEFSHGTAMASLIAADSGYAGIEGLAPAAKILPIAVPLVSVIHHGEPPRNATAKAINYAADHGARIISMSLGGPRSEDEDRVPCPRDLQDAVLHALGKGALVVAASGNSAQSGSPVEEPGVCLGVVSVGAVDARSQVTGFSSRHRYLSVTAPGSNIATLNREPNTAFIGSGTSHATALTSAALALVWSKYPRESGRQILSRLLSTATDRGPKGRDPEYGVGVIDPAAAIAAGSAAASNPVLDAVAPLLALSRARATAAKPPAATPQPDAPLGEYRVAGIRPAGLDADVYLPAAGSAAFGVLALVLLAIAVRRRRRSARAGRAARPGWSG